MLRKSNCCVETVTLEKFEELASPKKKLSRKSRQICKKGFIVWKQKIPNKNSDYVIFPESFPHPDKYSWRISHKYLSGWPELTKEEINR